MGLLKKGRNNGADNLIALLASKSAANLPGEDETDWGSDYVNCYAWAANCESPLSGKPDPGKFSKKKAKAGNVFTAELLINGARADGMFYGANYPENKSLEDLSGYYCVALYLSKNGADHHWYRRDPLTGYWTHKPGPQGIRNYSSGFAVLPQSLNLANHNYKTENTNYQFVAYFYVPEEGIQVG